MSERNIWKLPPASQRSRHDVVGRARMSRLWWCAIVAQLAATQVASIALNLPKFVSRIHEENIWWARVDLNHESNRYERPALTRLSYTPEIGATGKT